MKKTIWSHPSGAWAFAVALSACSGLVWGQAATTTPPDAPESAAEPAAPKAAPFSKPSWAEFKPLEHKFGDYSLHLAPADFELRPRWQGGKPALKLGGIFLDMQLAKKTPLEQDWTRTQGLRGRINGEINTVSGSSLSVSGEVFRTWTGTHSNGIVAKYDVGLGPYYDIRNNRTQLVFSAQQEWRGNLFNVNLFGQKDLRWLVQANETLAQRIQGKRDEDAPRNGLSYSVLLGIEQEFDYVVFGRSTKFRLIYGPEFYGNPDKTFRVKPRLRLRLLI